MRYFIFLVFGFLIFSCQTKEKKRVNCLVHHTGTYVFENGEEKIFIHRKGDRQYEFTQSGDTISVHEVTWKDGCTYALSLIEGDSATRAFQGKKTLTVTITGGDEESYEFVARMPDMEGGQLRGVLKKTVY